MVLHSSARLAMLVWLILNGLARAAAAHPGVVYGLAGASAAVALAGLWWLVGWVLGAL